MSSNLPSDKNNSKKPADSFGELRKAMNELFNDKPIRGFLQSIDDFFKTPFPFESGFHLETTETENEYIVTAELPGIKREQINLNITGNYLTISVENNELETAEDNINHVYSRKFVRQASSRTVSLPHAINEKMIKASYRDGLLQVRIPREKGKIIEID
ncbi:Hsp20/alpha crystallin family protein [Neobacillus mesonae]|uniref:Hsp20/alpha crystallin family protein n=1 Tax=Neobacillus mesonae TaxID=1193713 RepID=UPI00203EE861|nr:Hsp20/alpha crystallin family protein [Neobacillus mesonae]MCM3566830.1 Hsp20/alpha crystallin family protein [Neobacillus mesonae]